MLDENAFEPEIGTIYLEDLEIGMSRSLSRILCDHSISKFADVSADHNPVHTCDVYAKDTMFEGRIAHGMLTAALISAVIGQQLPGHGTVYLKQNLTFLAPVRPGDRVDTKVTVREIIEHKSRVLLDCKCSVGDTVVLKGEALVIAPRRPETA